MSNTGKVKVYHHWRKGEEVRYPRLSEDGLRSFCKGVVYDVLEDGRIIILDEARFEFWWFTEQYAQDYIAHKEGEHFKFRR